MAQRVTANQRVGRPAAKGKAPIDQFFDAVRNPGSQSTILSKKTPGRPSKVAKPPKAPKARSQIIRPAPTVNIKKVGGGIANRPEISPELRAYAKAHGGLVPIEKKHGRYVPVKGAVRSGSSPWYPTSGQVSAAVNDVLNIPAGVYGAGKAEVGDIGSAATGDFTFPRTRKLGKGIYEGMKYSLQHPEKDPFGTALTLSSLGGPVARLGEVGEAGAVGGLRAAARAAVNRGPQSTASRTLKLGDFETQGLYSRSSSARYAQRAHDTIVQKAAKLSPGGKSAEYLAGRIGREERKNRLVREAIQRAPAAALHRHHLTTPQQAALRAYAENTPTDLRAAFHERSAAGAGAAAKARHGVKAKVNRLAGKYLTTDEHGNVQFAPSKQGRKLAGIYKEMEQAAHHRERLMGEVGFTPSEFRVNAPGEIVRHGYAERPTPPPTPGQLSLVEPAGPVNPGRMRVPYQSRRAPKALAGPGRIGTSGTVAAQAKVPGTFTNEYTGGLLRSGKFREASTKLVAESNLEAQRYHALTAGLERLKAAVHEGPPRKGDVPVRLVPKLSPAAQDLLHKAEEGINLSREERAALGKDFEAFHKQAFPDHLTPDEIRKGEIGYINSKLLGGLNRNPGGGRWPVWDEANSVAKAALIYGKPGYIPANLAGNIALNLSQQGLLVLKNLPKAAALSRRLGTTEAAKIDSIMGSGLSRGIVGDESRMLEHAVGKLADVVGTPTDRYTRRASFLYVAAREGFRSPAKLRQLLTDPAQEDKLVLIGREARDKAIEYDNLTGREKAYVRKLVFIYPWVKGSTTYAGRFLRDNPHQSNVLYRLGAQGKAEQDKQLGARPSYLEGIFKVGGSAANPLTVNPAAMANFGTPAQLLDMARGIVSGQMTKQDWPLGMLNPGLQIGVGAAAGINPNTGGSIKSPLDAVTGFAKTLPQVTLAQAMTGKGASPQAIYQRGKGETLGKYTVGSVFPATTSKANLNAVAVNEQKANWSPKRKATYTMQQKQADYVAQLKKYGVHEAFEANGQLGAGQQKAWKRQTQLKLAITNLPHYHNPTPAQKLAYQKRKLTIAIDLAVKTGNWNDGELGSAAAYKAAVARATKAYTLSSAYNWISKNLLGGAVISEWRAYARSKNPAAFR